MSYSNKRNVEVAVRIEVRSNGSSAERGRGAGRKSWILKNVIFTLATDPPRPTGAPTQYRLGTVRQSAKVT